MAFSQSSPIYLQIADTICESIISGEWAEEERIPSVREMSVESEVNPNTIARTYAHLQELNIIYNKRGIGYFVSPGAGQTAREHMKKQFVKEALPPIFRMMDLLEMDIEDLKTYRDETTRGEQK